MILSSTSIFFENAAEIIFLAAMLALQNIVTWLRNQKPKKEMKLTLESIAADVTVCKKDIGDCKASIQSVRAQQRARLEFQLNASSDMYLLFDENGECTFANEAAVEFVERPREDLLYQGWIDIIYPQQEKDRVIKLFDNAIGRQTSFDVETVMITAKTRIIHKVCIQAKPIWDDEGNPMWYSSKLIVIKPHE